MILIGVIKEMPEKQNTANGCSQDSDAIVDRHGNDIHITCITYSHRFGNINTYSVIEGVEVREIYGK